jgi:hypothetical protein
VRRAARRTISPYWPGRVPRIPARSQCPGPRPQPTADLLAALPDSPTPSGNRRVALAARAACRQAGTMSREITRSQQFTREQVLAGLVLALGLFSTVCAFVPAWHVPGSWSGLIGLALGAVAQMLSTSTAQRWVIVPGWVLSFIGLAIGIDNGGLW